MSNRHVSSFLLLAIALLASGASAQTPVRPAQFIVPPSGETQFLAGSAMDGAGNLTFLWTTLNGEVFTRSFSSADVPLGPAVRLEDPRYQAWADTVVTNERGDVLTTWSRSGTFGPTGYFLRRTSPVLPTLTLKLKGPGDVAVDRNGNFVAVWSAYTPDGYRVFGQRYNADGTPQGVEFEASASRIGKDHISPSVAMNPETGEFVVVWEVRGRGRIGVGVYGQRFGFTSGRQGSQFAVFAPPANERPSSIQPFAAQVARSARGGFLVIWRHPFADLKVDILGQRYNNDGVAVGDRLVFAENEVLPDSRPQVAMSPAGDFVVTWDDGGTSPQWFRLFKRNGVPAGPVISQPGLGGAPYYGTGRPAYGANGTFVYGWTNYNDEGDFGYTISFQRFTGIALPPG